MYRHNNSRDRSFPGWLIVLALGIGSTDVARARTELDDGAEPQAPVCSRREPVYP